MYETLLSKIDNDQIPKEYGGASEYALGEHPYEASPFEQVWGEVKRLVRSPPPLVFGSTFFLLMFITKGARRWVLSLVRGQGLALKGRGAERHSREEFSATEHFVYIFTSLLMSSKR